MVRPSSSPFLLLLFLLLSALIALATAASAFVLAPSPCCRSVSHSGKSIRRHLAASSSGGEKKVKAATAAASKKEEQKEEPAWARVSVLESRPVAEGLIHVAIDGGDLMASYSVPGQYVQLKPHAPGAKPGFFAVASPPSVKSGSSRAEFLIKKTENTAWLCEAQAGEVIDMTPAMGKGYKIQSLDEEGINFVLLLAAGSGIAPIRAAIESEMLGLKKMSRYSRLYLGVRSPAHLPYTEKFDAWREKGLEIIPCFSRAPVPMNSSGYWGYVQQGLAGDDIRRPDKTAALVCGMKDMANLSTHILKQKGVAPERILFNF